MTKLKNPQLKYYDVTLEINAPGILTYRILAESPERAFELSQQIGSSPIGVKYFLARKKKIKASVYDAGTLMVRFIKNFVR